MSPETKTHFNRAIDEIDKRLGQECQLKFLKDGKADTSRNNLTVNAILRVRSPERSTLAGGRKQGWKGSVEGQKATLHISKSRYPDLKIVIGDKVLSEGHWYEVANVNTRDQLRLKVELNRS